MPGVAIGDERNMISTTATVSRIAPGLITACLIFGSALALAADAPKPKAGDVKKMEAALPDKAPATPAHPHKVLVYGNANKFVHSSIPLGQETIAKLGEKTGAYIGTVSNDPAEFDADRLKNY